MNARWIVLGVVLCTGCAGPDDLPEPVPDANEEFLTAFETVVSTLERIDSVPATREAREAIIVQTAVIERAIARDLSVPADEREPMHDFSSRWNALHTRLGAALARLTPPMRSELTDALGSLARTLYNPTEAGPPGTALRVPLDRFPAVLGGWRQVGRDADTDIEFTLPDLILRRSYEKTGATILLDVAYDGSGEGRRRLTRDAAVLLTEAGYTVTEIGESPPSVSSPTGRRIRASHISATGPLIGPRPNGSGRALRDPRPTAHNPKPT